MTQTICDICGEVIDFPRYMVETNSDLSRYGGISIVEGAYPQHYDLCKKHYSELMAFAKQLKAEKQGVKQDG